MVLTLSAHSRRDATRRRAALQRLAAVLAGHALLLLVLLQLGPPVQEQRAPVFVRLVSPPSPEPRPAPPFASPPSVRAAPAKPRPAAPPKPASPAPAVIDELAPVMSAVESPAPEPLSPSDTTSASPARSAVASAAPAAAVIPPRFDAAYLDNPRPEYPRIARRMGEHGTVTLRVLVSAAGMPEKVEIGTSSGSPRLDRAAQDAVTQWKFFPARQGDQPVAAWVMVPITFRLEG